MKISELVKALLSVWVEHGDIEVMPYTWEDQGRDRVERGCEDVAVSDWHDGNYQPARKVVSF